MGTLTEEHNLEQALQAFLRQQAQGIAAGDPATTRLLLALVAENQRLRKELRDLAQGHEQLAAQLRQYSEQRRKVVSPAPALPRVERPLSYWAERVPAYGEKAELSGDEATRYLARPRIEPHQITLSEEDLARQPSWRKRYLRDHGRPQWQYSLSALAIVLIVAITVAFLWLYLGIML